MVWGEITEGSCTLLPVIDGNLTGIRYGDLIQTTVLPFIEDERRQGRRVVMQHDNARPQVVTTFLQDNNVDIIIRLFRFTRS